MRTRSILGILECDGGSAVVAGTEASGMRGLSDDQDRGRLWLTEVKNLLA
ncbi:hypothetical protein BXY51_009169 [Actinoplanes cyaneus]|nr:hypothetical protein [Actinoplanes cyaneus]